MRYMADVVLRQYSRPQSCLISAHLPTAEEWTAELTVALQWALWATEFEHTQVGPTRVETLAILPCQKIVLKSNDVRMKGIANHCFTSLYDFRFLAGCKVFKLLLLQTKELRNSGDENARILQAHQAEGIDPPKGLRHDFQDLMILVSGLELYLLFVDFTFQSKNLHLRIFLE